ncbi:SMP-30/Gluconolaconase/LRE-like region-domain-containing protein [Vararia minispora EC-137]|uniref:SMP-30/Gluconolaconase/LRE-like region-domain-containing protein n=1 Tax=Vararia minispora EC-137 TaxID=1314806 RepID=A0ACB8QRL2_9AGAM|nr:SMP-30/Gluconolaconase/LRE-like region-domain-containing protein [Vararia minispora EC-137]
MRGEEGTTKLSFVEHIVVHEPFLRVGCMLGEGPLYEAQTFTLHFVDIFEKRVRVRCETSSNHVVPQSQVFHLDIRTLELSIDQYDEPITCLALRRGGRGLACATASGIATIEEGKLQYLARPIEVEDRPYTRFNDGACDSEGRFFIGTMFSKEKGIPGVLYKFDPKDMSCVVVDPGPFTDSNGIAWSLDERTMYFTDSLNNVIYAYDYEDGVISGRRVFADTGSILRLKNSYPDGLCMDDEGCIWSARWGGSCIVRFNREGIIDVQIDLPTVHRVTACCFGGLNNDELFITTAHCSVLGGNNDLQKGHPDSGHLFKVEFAGKYRGGRWRHEFAL